VVPPLILTIVTGLALAILAYFFALLVRNQAVFVPLSQKTIDKMLRMANARPNDVLFDLGSGDGRVVIAAARCYGVRAVGIEKSRILAWLSRRAIRRSGVQDKVRIVNGDFFRQDLSEATIVTAYLSRRINRSLEPKLSKELKEGTRILSADHTFKFRETAKVKTGHFWTHLYIR
jgi:ubiquinone/menaquinone biosynthesis C-methylase UbiE